eukprot:2708073-Amphidinium_carterae.1
MAQSNSPKDGPIPGYRLVEYDYEIESGAGERSGKHLGSRILGGYCAQKMQLAPVGIEALELS